MVDYRHAREPIHPWRWVAGVVVVAITAFLVKAFATSPNIHWDQVGTYLTDGTILEGLQLTIELAVVAELVGIVLGVVLATMRMSANPVLNIVSGVYIWLFRGLPGLVQILLWYNLALVFPRLGFGIPGTSWYVSASTNQVITPTVAAIIALGLYEAAFMAEFVRGGIESIDPGQTEAACALGLNRYTRFRYVVLPQATRAIVPAIGNDFISMLKTTSLISVIAANELLHAAQTISAQNFFTIELLIVASIWYLAVVTVASWAQAWIERRFRRSDRHHRRSGLEQLLLRWRDRMRRRIPEEIDWQAGGGLT